MGRNEGCLPCAKYGVCDANAGAEPTRGVLVNMASVAGRAIGL